MWRTKPHNQTLNAGSPRKTFGVSQLACRQQFDCQILESLSLFKR
jgi:hypothetical protein